MYSLFNNKQEFLCCYKVILIKLNLSNIKSWFSFSTFFSSNVYTTANWTKVHSGCITPLVQWFIITNIFPVHSTVQTKGYSYAVSSQHSLLTTQSVVKSFTTSPSLSHNNWKPTFIRQTNSWELNHRQSGHFSSHAEPFIRMQLWHQLRSD